MYSLIIDKGAVQDLDDLWVTDPIAAKRIAAFIQQTQADQDVLDRLLQDHYGGARNPASFHVRQWVTQQRGRVSRNLWRFKLWDLENKGLFYRVIYAFVPKTKQVLVLGIVKKEVPGGWDYQPDHPLTLRVVAAYDSI